MAGTIGSYKIAFSPDLSSFRGLGQQIQQAIGQAPLKAPAITPPDTSSISSAVKKAAEGTGTIPGPKIGAPDTTVFDTAIAKLKSKTEPVLSAISGAFGKLKTAGKVGLAGAVAGVAAMAPAALEASDSIDDFKASMQFAGISEQEYNAAAAAADKYANATEYDLTDLLNTSAILGSNGVKDFESLAEAIGGFNSAAGGTADTYGSVALVMGQAAAQGKIMTGDWNQLTNAVPGGAHVLQQALQNAGAYTGDFREALSKSEISADELFAAVKQLGNSDVAQQAAKSSTTFRGAWANATAEIQTQLRNAFDSIKPDVTDAINAAIPIIDAIGPKVSAGIKIAVDAIKAIIPVLQELWPKISAAISMTVSALSAVFSWVIAHKDWLSPLVAGVVGFVAAMKTITIVTGIIGGVSKAFTALKAAGSIITIVKSAWMALSAAFGLSPIGLVITLIAGLVAALVWFFTQTETGRKMWADFSATMAQVWQNIVTAVSNGWQALLQWFSSAGESIKTTWNNTWKAVGDFFTSIWNGIKKAFSNAGEWLKNSMIDLKNSIVGAFTGAGNWLKNAGKHIITGLWSGIVSGASWLWGKLTGLAAKIVGFVKKLFKIHSPSKVFRDEIGIYLSKGLGVGLLDGASAVYRQADTMASKLVSTLSVSPEATWSLSGAQQQLLAAQQPVALAGAGYGVAQPQVTINQEVSKADSLIDVYLQTKRAAQGYFYRQ